MKFDFDACIKSGVEQAMKECELTIGMSLKEAVEKQIPKKLKKVDEQFKCPDCDCVMAFTQCSANTYKTLGMYKYCPDCGQALDWAEV